MAKRRGKRQVVTAVELGTRFIKVLVGEFQGDGSVSLLGAGVEPSLKVVKGEIVDVMAVHQQLEKALITAEDQAGTDIENVYLAVSGAHIDAFNTVGSTVPASPDHRIHEFDIEAANRNALAYPLPPDRERLQYFRREYRVDGREVDNPLNLFGSRLDAGAHIIHGQLTRLQTVSGLVADALGLEDEPKEMVFSAVAAGMGSLLPEEAERGTLVIDLGAGVTDYALFRGPEHCFHSRQITIGCEHIANDLYLGLRLTPQRGRELLENLGEVGAAVMTPDGRTRLTEIEVATGQPRRSLPVSTVEQVVEMRLQELFEYIRTDLERHDMIRYIGHGVKLCGGGALIPRVEDLARTVFEMPVAVGYPVRASGPRDILSSPAFVTPVGVLRFGRMRLEAQGPAHLSPIEMFLNDLRRIVDVFRGHKAFQW